MSFGAGMKIDGPFPQNLLLLLLLLHVMSSVRFFQPGLSPVLSSPGLEVVPARAVPPRLLT